LTDAAAALGVSTRTLQRRIAAGELPSRKDERGRVMVQVALDALPPEVAATHALQTHADAHQQQAVALAQQVAVLTRLAEQHHAELLQVRADNRLAIRAWQVAASVAVAASVILGAVSIRNGSDGVTSRQPDDMAVVPAPAVLQRVRQVSVVDDAWKGVPFAMPD
jgi:phage protein D